MSRKIIDERIGNLGSIGDQLAVDAQEDFPEIKEALKRLEAHVRRLCREWSYNYEKEQGNLKYSDDELERKQWEADDFKFAAQELGKERIEKYFDDIATKYEERAPIADSIVRGEQEENIFRDLEDGRSVLVRGYWRTGKTSMLFSLKSHKYSDCEDLFIDASADYKSRKCDIEQFKNRFGIHHVARLLTSCEYQGDDHHERNAIETSKKEEIMQSGKTPFEYLNDYMFARGSVALVEIDEAIGFADDEEKMSHLASLSRYPALRVLIVLHRISKHEEMIERIFGGFKTHFITPISSEESATLITKPVENTQVKFTDDAIDELHRFTGGRPMEIQNVCNALMDPMSEVAKYQAIYDASDIQAVTKDWDHYEFFEVARDTYRRILEYALSEEERKIIEKLAEVGSMQIDEVVDMEAMDNLGRSGLLQVSEDKLSVSVKGELLRKYALFHKAEME